MTTKFVINNYSTLYNTFKENISRNTGLNNWNSDSVVRSIVEPIGAELTRLNSATSAVLDSLTLARAVGDDLDKIGLAYGVDRLRPVKASTVEGDYNFSFYVSSGRFGDLNNGNPITIPKGTIVGISGAGGSLVKYSVVNNLTLAPNESNKYCSIRAFGFGEKFNVSSKMLNQHSFNGLSSGGLKCSNRLPIGNGRGEELDDDYRFRIYKRYSESYQITAESLRLSGMRVPGIVKQRFVKNYFGYGRSAVFLFGANNEISQSIVNQYQRNISSSLGMYSEVVAMPGVRVYLDLDLTLYLSKDIGATEQNQLKNKIYMESSNYLIENSESESLSLARMIFYLQNRIPMISKISSREDRSKIIEAAYIRRNYGGSNIGGSERVKLVSPEYILKNNEFLTIGSISCRLERI